MLLYKKKSQQQGHVAGKVGSKRFLITVTVLGSAGPIRFVVKEEDLVSSVIGTALKSYAREGRLPILGSDLNDFFLYCRNAVGEPGVLSPCETIGSRGARNFMLCKKPQSTKEEEDDARTAAAITRKGSWCWKSWINKALNPKISAH